MVETLIGEIFVMRDREGCDEGEAVDTDMVDELMAFYSDDGSKGNGDELKITRDNIKALIMVRN